ncbi:hypothetical protein LFM09_28805 [Lentzea alba]|uniref:AMIN-like domain-containing (lipo)protein n=1 Tax=Lentzea alba TaxID=2714351 RepID=UPI0039BEFD4F
MNRRIAAVLLAVLAVFTLAPAASAQSTPTLSDIRTGRHADFDRVVLDMSGQPAEHRVMVRPDVSHCASGEPIPVKGNQVLLTVLIGAAAHDENGNPTYTGPRLFETPGLANVRGVAITCDWEGTLDVAVGYDDTYSWHRVFTLTNPDRVVIDIGH